MRHLQVLATPFSECFPPYHIAELKHDCLYSGLPKWIKAVVAYLKGSTNEKTYSDYLWVARETEKEEAMEPSHSQTANSTSKPKMSFFPLQKLKGTQPARDPAVWVSHLEEESTDKEEGAESEDQDGIKGVIKEFIVCLAKAVKEAQLEEKCCYHYSSPEHFICDCLLVKVSITDLHLNQKEGMVPKKGAQAPRGKVTMPKVPKDGMPKA